MRKPQRSRRAAWLAASAFAGAAAAQAPEGSLEPVCLVSVLRNGSFAEAADPELGGVPWWWTPSGEGGVVVTEAGTPELLVKGERASVMQPVAVYAPWIGDVVLRGRVRGRGTLTVYAGGTVAQEFDQRPSDPRSFEVVLRDATGLQGRLGPRLRIQLSGASDFGAPVPCWWSAMEVLAPLPCPSEDALRAEVRAHFGTYAGAVLRAALDDAGTRSTPFVAFDFDADSGERIAGPPRRRVGDVAFYDLLLRAWRVEADPAWEAALCAFLDAYLELCLHPATGLECRWDPTADRRVEDEPVQIHRGLAFLLDVAEGGPESYAARALAAAERMGRAVLERGVLPDGEVAASYRPSDGAPFFDYPHLRRLDVPAQLARLAARCADEELAAALLRAAEEACLTLAYDHYWPGDWDSIDPGFDDNFGNYGESATTMWEAHPQNEVFRSLALSGARHYAPLWHNALRYGGNVAADQVRCWDVFARIARLEPELSAETGELLLAAAHSHFKGEQLTSGAWIDTTVKNFQTVALPVGDVGGVPQNLLEGLALVYGAGELGLATDEIRAMYAAVLRITAATFGRPHGFLAGLPAETPAAVNPAYAGSARVAFGLVAMLEALAR